MSRRPPPSRRSAPPAQGESRPPGRYTVRRTVPNSARPGQRLRSTDRVRGERPVTVAAHVARSATPRRARPGGVLADRLRPGAVRRQRLQAARPPQQRVDLRQRRPVRAARDRAVRAGRGLPGGQVRPPAAGAPGHRPGLPRDRLGDRDGAVGALLAVPDARPDPGGRAGDRAGADPGDRPVRRPGAAARAGALVPRAGRRVGGLRRCCSRWSASRCRRTGSPGCGSTRCRPVCSSASRPCWSSSTCWPGPRPDRVRAGPDRCTRWCCCSSPAG